MNKPKVCTEQHLTYLDELRESGQTNMFGAAAYLSRKFKELLNPRVAKKVLIYWINTSGSRIEEG